MSGDPVPPPDGEAPAEGAALADPAAEGDAAPAGQPADDAAASEPAEATGTEATAVAVPAEATAASDSAAGSPDEPSWAAGEPAGDSPAEPPEAAAGDAAAGAPVAAGDAGPPPPRLPSILESLLFVADRPLGARDLAALVDEPDPARVEGALAVLAGEWQARGVQLQAVAGGWQLRTNPQNAFWVQRLVSQKPVRLTRSQLETLAIVAYRQPITRPEIDEIRGVDSGGTLKTLLERSLVRILGKKEEPGRPLLYGTTREFLEFFNLGDLRQLPTLREFHELSDEHRAQVEALERAAPPGSVEAAGAPAAAPPPLLRVELSDAPLDEDLGHIDRLIEEAGGRARAAAEALGTALPDAEGAPGRGGPARPAAGSSDGSDPSGAEEA